MKKVKSITVNTVHANKKSIEKIIKRLNPDIENMEGAAVFKVCNFFNTPCIQLRSISNYVEKKIKNGIFLLQYKISILKLNKLFLDL